MTHIYDLKKNLKLKHKLFKLKGSRESLPTAWEFFFDSWTNFFNQGLRYTPDFIAQSFAVQSDDAVTR